MDDDKVAKAKTELEKLREDRKVLDEKMGAIDVVIQEQVVAKSKAESDLAALVINISNEQVHNLCAEVPHAGRTSIAATAIESFFEALPPEVANTPQGKNTMEIESAPDSEKAKKKAKKTGEAFRRLNFKPRDQYGRLPVPQGEDCHQCWAF